MAGPIVLSMVAYTLMETLDQVMVGDLGTDALAAVGPAGLWAYLLASVVIGVVTCVSTFISQSIGRGHPEWAASYTWQGVHIGTITGLVALCAWPVAGRLFQTMGHTPEVTALETIYFQVRLLGFAPMVYIFAFTAFFMAVERPQIPMYAAFAANGINAGLNYGLIYGHFGLPALGVAGAAWGTVISQWLQAVLLLAVFLGRTNHGAYRTRTEWGIHVGRFTELVRVGFPNGMFFLMDVATWGLFISYLVGGFGATQLAANNIAIAFMKLSFMPALAINQAIGPIVGQYIGRGDFVRAKNRAWTAVRITVAYMGVLGVIVASAGPFLIGLLFPDAEPEVAAIGHRLLILAAIFQAFDAVNIVISGALRGAGDTRFMMWTTLVAAYFIFLPMAWTIAIGLDGQAVGAWIAAALYIAGLSLVMSWRFYSERWRAINIFDETPNESVAEAAALGAAAPVTAAPAPPRHSHDAA